MQTSTQASNKAYLAAIVVLAILVGALGTYAATNHTTTTETVTLPPTTVTEPYTGPTSTYTPPPTSSSSSSTTTTSTPPTQPDASCLNNTQNYNEKYFIIPLNEQTTIQKSNYGVGFVTNFFIPYGATGQYSLTLNTNITKGYNLTVDIWNTTNPKFVDLGNHSTLYSTTLTAATLSKQGSLPAGTYAINVNGYRSTGDIISVDQYLKVSYSPLPGATCQGTFENTAKTLVGLAPPGKGEWQFFFYVPNNTVGNLSMTFTSNATLSINIGTGFEGIYKMYTEQSGTITLNNLPPGTYQVYIYPNTFQQDAMLQITAKASYPTT